MLAALGNPTVDYFSLDIEGAELLVLMTIPWAKVDITVLDIEYPHIGKVFPGSYNDMVQLLKRAGYDSMKVMVNDAFFWKSKNELDKSHRTGTPFKSEDRGIGKKELQSTFVNLNKYKRFEWSE